MLMFVFMLEVQRWPCCHEMHKARRLEDLMLLVMNIACSPMNRKQGRIMCARLGCSNWLIHLEETDEKL